MCGMVAILNVKEQTHELREKALKMSQKIRHRGPDWSGIYCGGTAILAHERLSIVDPESGGQPLFSPDKKQVLAVNGEIYNHQEIRRRFAGQYEFQTGSDCEVILALYREFVSGLGDSSFSRLGEDTNIPKQPNDQETWSKQDSPSALGARCSDCCPPSTRLTPSPPNTQHKPTTYPSLTSKPPTLGGWGSEQAPPKCDKQ